VASIQLTSPLILAGDPTLPNHPVTKQYVDNKANNLSASGFSAGLLNVTRLPSFTGDIEIPAGSGAANLSVQIGLIEGTYTKLVLDSRGRVKSAGFLTSDDIVNMDFSKITTGKPTTLAGYGITNAIGLSGGTVEGPLVTSATPTDALHLVTRSYVDAMIVASGESLSVGDIVRKGYTSTPSGFLRANGASVSKTTYANLYSIIGDRYFNPVEPGAGLPWSQQYSINTTQSGTINSWEESSGWNSLGGVFVATKNYVHCLGGYEVASGAYYTVQSKPINSDGSLGATQTSLCPNIPAHAQGGIPMVVKNRVYIFSRTNGEVYYAAINSDGTLGTWYASISMPSTFTDFSPVLVGNRIYLIGGANASGRTAYIYTTTVNSDGSLNTWTITTSLPSVVAEAQVAVVKNKIYLIGGKNAADTLLSTIYVTTVNPDGTLGTWSLYTPFPVAIANAAVYVTRSTVYVIGGEGATNRWTVWSNPIDADGDLGSWSSVMNLPVECIYPKAMALKNRLYLTGGIRSGGAQGNMSETSAVVSGGVNDFSPYYDGSAGTISLTNFTLPDFSTKETFNTRYFVKY
jgi:N-acetylneuraminic acid mutarotase